MKAESIALAGALRRSRGRNGRRETVTVGSGKGRPARSHKTVAMANRPQSALSRCWRGPGAKRNAGHPKWLDSRAVSRATIGDGAESHISMDRCGPGEKQRATQWWRKWPTIAAGPRDVAALR